MNEDYGHEHCHPGPEDGARIVTRMQPEARSIEARSIGAIEQEVSRYHKLTEQADNIISELEDRLQPAIRAEEKEKGTLALKERLADPVNQGGSQFACRLHEYNIKIVHTIERIRSIIDRVEL